MSSLPSLVLMGHDVRPTDLRRVEPALDTVVDADGLTGVLTEVARVGYRFVGFDEFMTRRHRGSVALLTFDDGYRGVATVAQPILERMGVPALVFLVTGVLDGPRDGFPHWLHELRDNWATIAGDERGATFDSHPAVGRVLARTRFCSLGELFSIAPESAHDAFERVLSLEELCELGRLVARTPGLGRRTMTRQEVEDVTRSGLIDVGAHSSTHRAFGRLTEAEVDFEIKESLRVVSEMRGRPPSETAFAYPYGSFTAQAVAAVGSRCKAGFTCSSRPVSRLDHRAMIPRFNLERGMPARARGITAMASATELLRERLTLYERTELGRTVSRHVKHLARLARERGTSGAGTTRPAGARALPAPGGSIRPQRAG